MPDQPEQSWFRDRRVIAFGAASALGGFLLALLIFGEPWHLPPAWGDIPTWLTAVVGGVAAWFVLGQLQQQAKVIKDEFERNVARDKLLDGQLRELADREGSQQRQQAEHVVMAPGEITTTSTAYEQLYGGEDRGANCTVANESGRPVRQVACQLILDGTPIAATWFADRLTSAPVDPRLPRFVGSRDADNKHADGSFRTLLSGRTVMARFDIPENITAYATSHYVIRFLDDAERRWELDQDNRLRRAPDEDW
jgi:hypothetical protein